MWPGLGNVIMPVSSATPPCKPPRERKSLVRLRFSFSKMQRRLVSKVYPLSRMASRRLSRSTRNQLSMARSKGYKLALAQTGRFLNEECWREFYRIYLTSDSTSQEG